MTIPRLLFRRSVAAAAAVAVTGLTALLRPVLLDALPDKHVQLKDIQKPSYPQLVDGEEVLHATPEVPQIEMMQAGHNEGQ